MSIKTNKLNIAMVGYHNTLPFLYGLNKARDHYHLILDVPSKCMDYFVNGEADIALVPIANLIDRNDYQIITDYCIGCVGEVGTVCLYAHQPIEQLDTIYLDSDSRTSQLLTRILCEHHWNVKVDFVEVDARSIDVNELNPKEGLLMIGDKAFGAAKKYEFTYDLGLEWESMTNLPFAFAVWIARQDVESDIINELNDTLALGVDNIDLVLESNRSLSRKIDLKSYFEKYIDYKYDADKKRAFEVYRELGSKLISV